MPKNDLRTKRILEKIRKHEQVCFNCGHMQMAHLRTCIDVDRKRSTADIWIACGCKEFMPSDNLDYVEWLANKRNLI